MYARLARSHPADQPNRSQSGIVFQPAYKVAGKSYSRASFQALLFRFPTKEPDFERARGDRWTLSSIRLVCRTEIVRFQTRACKLSRGDVYLYVKLHGSFGMESTTPRVYEQRGGFTTVRPFSRKTEEWLASLDTFPRRTKWFVSARGGDGR